MRKRRDIEGISLSFLDVISCGFGALILMLVLTKVFEPVVIEETIEQLTSYLAELQLKLVEIRGESRTLSREMIRKEDTLEDDIHALEALQGNLAELEQRHTTTVDTTFLANEIEKKLATAKQSLTEEMKRLLAEYKKNQEDNTVGGIPVDSEYVIFIIDTSGSMFGNAWPLVVRKLQEVLDVYPRLKGIQVLSDMGRYMFPQYTGQWIQDTPSRRQAIIRMLETWNVLSNSSPVEGIRTAISTYYSPDKKISLYVFGDEYSGRSIQRVVDVVDRINRKDEDGNCMVRIHTVGFPVQFDYRVPDRRTGINFSVLMRTLSRRNCGTFVGLNSYEL
jgi:hypothetical protein|tara:strand:+ start:3514 stop:4515 length:1002 start_codon:yes stop_codon:yes gene_type:complete